MQDLSKEASFYYDFAKALFRSADKDKAEWAPVVKLVLPELVAASELKENDRHAESDPICAHAKVGIYNLASATMTYIFPMGHRWFSFTNAQPNFNDSDGDFEEEDEAEEYFARCTDIAQMELMRSNFYTEMNAVAIDRCAPGTGLLLAEMDEIEDGLVFTHVPAGTFAIAQDAHHCVNTAVRRFNFTPLQMVEEFGFDNLPDEAKRQYERPDERCNVEREIWHLVCPRPNVSVLGFEHQTPTERPFLSLYFDVASRKLLSESGYFEFPYMATRFIRYGNERYGVSPLMTLKDVIPQEMKMSDALVIGGQRAAVPSVILPADLESDIDLRPAGRTLIPTQYINSAVPREFAPPQQLAHLNEALLSKRKEIDDALYTSVLQTISSQDRFMSATEVNAREAEKILTFSNSFTQLQVDSRPLFNRIFALLFRAKKFAPLGKTPVSVARIEKGVDGVERTTVVMPTVKYCGKMAQALERVQSNSTRDVLAQHIQLASATQNPEVLVIYNFLRMARREAINAGVPAEYLNSISKVRGLLQQAEDARDAQQAAQNDAVAAQAERDHAQAYQLMQPQ